MKKLLVFVFLICSVFTFAQEKFSDDMRQVLSEATKRIAPNLKENRGSFGDKTVAVLPIKGDKDRTVTRDIENILANLKFKCVVGRENSSWNEIVKQIEWIERKNDILDQKTIIGFGKQMNAQILIYGEIRHHDSNAKRILAEISLQALDVETAKIVWSNSFKCRLYMKEDERGHVEMDRDMKIVLGKAFDKAKDSLKAKSHLLDGIKTVAVIPLAGDVDNYMTGLARGAIQDAGFMSMDMQIPTVSETRFALRDDSVNADGLFYGSIRDLNKQASSVEPLVREKKMKETITFFVEFQLFLEDTKTGNTLWSYTVPYAETQVILRDMTGDEKLKYLNEEVKGDLVDNWKEILKTIGYIIGGIVVLIFLLCGLKAFLSSRNVR